MRFVIVAAAAALLMLPAIAPAKACGAGKTAEAASIDLSAKTEKKMAKKTAKKKKEKVEYMRAAPM